MIKWQIFPFFYSVTEIHHFQSQKWGKANSQTSDSVKLEICLLPFLTSSSDVVELLTPKKRRRGFFSNVAADCVIGADVVSVAKTAGSELRRASIGWRSDVIEWAS